MQDPIEWERLLIGTCLIDQTKTPMDVLPADFSLQLHREIWSVLQELAARGGLGIKSLAQTLNDKGALVNLGGDNTARGEEYLEEISRIADPTTIDEYILRVKEASSKRSLQEIGKDLVVAARNGKAPNEIAETYIKKLIKVQHSGSREARQIGDGIEELEEKYEKIRSGEALQPWYPRTQAIFDIFGHADESDFVIVVASPGSGKSSYLRHEAIETALDGKAVLTITLENSREEAQTWAISKLTGISHKRLKNPDKMTAKEWEEFKEAEETVRLLPWYVEDVSFSNISTIIAVARRMAVTKELSLIQLDGMYLVEDSKEDEGKYQVISSVAQGLRSLSQELHVPIMASTQFSRKVNTHKSPELGDLLYAGENPARGIWGVVKKDLGVHANDLLKLFPENIDVEGKLKAYDNHGAVVLQMKILKNTGGETGWSGDFVWRKGTNRFESLEKGWDRQIIPRTPGTTSRTINPSPKPTKDTRR